jgi:hypothetical protein
MGSEMPSEEVGVQTETTFLPLIAKTSKNAKESKLYLPCTVDLLLGVISVLSEIILTKNWNPLLEID